MCKSPPIPTTQERLLRTFSKYVPVSSALLMVREEGFILVHNFRRLSNVHQKGKAWSRCDSVHTAESVKWHQDSQPGTKSRARLKPPPKDPPLPDRSYNLPKH